MARLELKNLTKRIGRETIVSDVSLAAQPGEIFGFLGPNGSGKTTTLRMILRLISPTSGQILVDGADIRSRQGRAVHIGSVIDPPGLFPYLSAREHLRQIGRLIGVPDKQINADALLEQVDLLAAADRPARKFSQGMKRRLAVAVALVGNPKLVVLDEPTAGLDPLGIRQIREILRGIVASGERTVFVSSHLLSEMESECHRMALLSRGELVGLGTVEELLAGERPVLEIEAAPIDKARAILADKAPGGSEPRVENQRIVLEVPGREDVPALVAALASEGVEVFSARFRRVSLEEYFAAKTAGDHPGESAREGAKNKEDAA